MLLDAFLEFSDPPIAGESTDKENSDQIEILSLEQTIQRSTLAAGKSGTAGTAKAHSDHSPITIIKPLDRSSPKLLQASCAGTLYKKAVISLCQPSGTSKTTSDRWKKIVYLEITLEVVHISRVHFVGHPALHHFGRAADFPIVAGSVLDMGPIEEIDLTYQKIEWLYKGGDGKSNISGKWNLETNKSA